MTVTSMAAVSPAVPPMAELVKLAWQTLLFVAGMSLSAIVFGLAVYGLTVVTGEVLYIIQRIKRER